MFSTEPQPSAPPPRSSLRAILPYTTVMTVLVILYVVYIMYSRYSSNREATQKAEQARAHAEQERNAAITQHGELTFTTFYASPGTIASGETAHICYGVMNADTVKIDPPIEQLKPTERHCMDIAPKKTTSYTITAANGQGQTKSLSVTVKVK